MHDWKVTRVLFRHSSALASSGGIIFMHGGIDWRGHAIQLSSIRRQKALCVMDLDPLPLSSTFSLRPRCEIPACKPRTAMPMPGEDFSAAEAFRAWRQMKFEGHGHEQSFSKRHLQHHTAAATGL
jgi:hypothetical protein